MTKVGVARLAFVVIVFSALELLCRLGIITRMTMIPPSEMVTSLWDIVESGRFNSDISFTFFNVVAAAVVAIGIGFLLGAGLHSLPRLRRPLEPLLSAYYAIPTFVFYPLLIVAFGVGRTALVVMGSMFGVVAMIVNTTLGLDHVPPAVERTGSVLKLVTGVKLAVAYSIIGIVAGEFILATAGIGKRVSFAYDNFDNRTMYGLLLLLLVAVMLVNGALSAWERRLHRRFGQR
jgi:NitT/TauT family transport system permease protein